jgi:hypothetical protein
MSTAVVETIDEALEILTRPGGPCDPYIDDIGSPELMKWFITEALTKFAADNMDLCRRSDPEELVESFLNHLRKTGHLL